MLLTTKTINHAATTRYLQPRRLQVLLFICHQKALTLPVCSLPFNFSTLQQEMSSCLPMPRTTRGCCACARVVTRVCTCAVGATAKRVCARTHLCAFGVGSWDAVPPGRAAARTQPLLRRSPSASHGLNFGKSASGQRSGREPACFGSAQRLGRCSSPSASTPLWLS